MIRLSAARIMAAEAAGTFGLVFAATGSIVYDGGTGGAMGAGFIAAAHFAALAVLVAAFGRHSMAHFNPAVTLGLWMSGYTPAGRVPAYLAAQAAGAFAASLAVRHALGGHAGLGYNHPDYAGYPLYAIYGTEAAATALLMGAVLLVVASGRGPLPAGAVIAGVVALDVYFLGPVSGASMNPIRSLAPAVVGGNTADLWLYWSAPFAAAAAVAWAFRGSRLGRLARPFY